MEWNDEYSKRYVGRRKTNKESGQVATKKNIIDSLIRRGIAPDRIEQTIKNAEVAAEKIATKASRVSRTENVQSLEL